MEWWCYTNFEGLSWKNCNIPELWTACVSFKMRKAVELHCAFGPIHYTLSKLWLFFNYLLWLIDYAIKLRILYGFLKLNSNNHPTVTTLRLGAADGIGTVMQRVESRQTRAASGRLRAASGRCPDGSGRRPDGSGVRTAFSRTRRVYSTSSRHPKVGALFTTVLI